MSTSKEAWVVCERVLAGWFGSTRNPLSGRNNVSDDGSRRVGDVVYPYAVLESKLLGKHSGIQRARKTWKEAKEIGKPFLHAEFLKGSKAVVALYMTKEDAARVCKMLGEQWKRDNPWR